MKYLALVLCLFAPMPALALSCVRPSIEQTYAEVAAAKESYLVVKGVITFDERKLPNANMNSQTAPKRTVIKARLNGHALNTAGFATPFDKPVDYVVRCLAVWCGGGQSGQEVIAFVQKTATGYTLEIGPCGGRSFAATRETADAALECMRGGACPP